MTKDIISAIGKRQVLRGHNPVCANVQVLYGWECDVLSISGSKKVYEFEVKISRGDFKKDQKKSKWKRFQRAIDKSCCPHYFTYVCPTGLIMLNELAEKIGLYYYDKGEITEIRDPSIMHAGNVDTVSLEKKIIRLYSERTFLGCAKMTYENRESAKLWEQYEKEREENTRKLIERGKQIRNEKGNIR